MYECAPILNQGDGLLKCTSLNSNLNKIETKTDIMGTNTKQTPIDKIKQYEAQYDKLSKDMVSYKQLYTNILYANRALQQKNYHLEIQLSEFKEIMAKYNESLTQTEHLRRQLEGKECILGKIKEENELVQY